MSRWKAFGIHLGISLAIFAVLAYLVVFVWYPDFFFDTDGGWQGIRIIVLVDLVLGPLLTLVVYKAGKKDLKIDLALIGVFQFLCLFAGTFVVWQERPIAIVYVDGQFNSLSKGSFESLGLEAPDLESFPGRYPKWLTVDIPSDPTEQSEIRRGAMNKQLPMNMLSDLYIPFNKTAAIVAEESTPKEELERYYRTTTVIEDFESRRGQPVTDFYNLPYVSRYGFTFFVYDPKTLDMVSLLPAVPPPKRPPETASS